MRNYIRLNWVSLESPTSENVGCGSADVRRIEISVIFAIHAWRGLSAKAVVKANRRGQLALWSWPNRGHDESFWVRSPASNSYATIHSTQL